MGISSLYVILWELLHPISVPVFQLGVGLYLIDKGFIVYKGNEPHVPPHPSSLSLSLCCQLAHLSPAAGRGGWGRSKPSPHHTCHLVSSQDLTPPAPGAPLKPAPSLPGTLSEHLRLDFYLQLNPICLPFIFHHPSFLIISDTEGYRFAVSSPMTEPLNTYLLGHV